jgi:hypothetical protein
MRGRYVLLSPVPYCSSAEMHPRAIQNGANTIAEGFLFAVAATLVLAETWRSARSQERRRDKVDDDIDDLTTRVQELTSRMKEMQDGLEARWDDERIRCVLSPLLPIYWDLMNANSDRTEELSRILQRIVEIGLRGGWAELEDRPLKLPSYLAQTTRLQEAPQTEGLKPNTAVDQDTRNS